MKKIGLLLIVLALCISIREEKVSASSSSVGIMIMNSDGSYTWYDFNESETRTKNVIQYSSNQTVMLPAYKISTLMDDIKYSYNSKTKQVTLSNKKNGRKIVGTVNSTKLNYYAKANSKGTVKKMKSRIYIAKSSGVMIPADALKYVMYSGGYDHIKAEDMIGFGYDCITYGETYIYSASAPLGDLPKATKVKGLSHTVRVTIPEGYSVVQIFDLLVKKGVCESTEGLFDACQNYAFDYERYPFLKEIEQYKGRCFRLEGYLYPDTNEYYRLCPPQDAIGVLLRNTKSKITEEMITRAKECGMSMDEIITLASIIEKEGTTAYDKKMISSVLINRLNQKMKLQVDATDFYIDRYIKPYNAGDIEEFKAQYNTYVRPALPVGPICNPGKEAIMAALYPEQSNYLFFCSDKEGKYYYSETYEEHLSNLD